MKRWNQLSYKQKLRLLGISVLPLLFLCYKFAFAKTVSEYKTYTLQNRHSLSADTTHVSFASLETKKIQIENILKEYELDTLSTNKNLITAVTGFCEENQLDLKEYKPINVADIDSIKLVTRSVVVEGDFIKCVQLVYALENEYQVGRVSSVNYKTYTDLKSKSTRLTCTIYIQNIIN
jgi:hypothetical protein